jgi:hypothetical protein
MEVHWRSASPPCFLEEQDNFKPHCDNYLAMQVSS